MSFYFLPHCILFYFFIFQLIALNHRCVDSYFHCNPLNMLSTVILWQTACGPEAEQKNNYSWVFLTSCQLFTTKVMPCFWIKMDTLGSGRRGKSIKDISRQNIKHLSKKYSSCMFSLTELMKLLRWEGNILLL